MKFLLKYTLAMQNFRTYRIAHLGSAVAQAARSEAVRLFSASEFPAVAKFGTSLFLFAAVLILQLCTSQYDKFAMLRLLPE